MTFLGKTVVWNCLLLKGVNVVQILVEHSAPVPKASVITDTFLSNNSFFTTYKTFNVSFHLNINFLLSLSLTDPGLASNVTVPPDSVTKAGLVQVSK